MKTVKIENLENMKEWVSDFKTKVGTKDIILLNGEMGAGKSQFVKFFVEAMGSKESCSPTFAIHNYYELENIHIDHIDLYRVEDEDDLESTGFWELFDQDKAIICIEWADRMEKNVFPRTWKIHEINISKLPRNENAREIQYLSLN